MTKEAFALRAARYKGERGLFATDGAGLDLIAGKDCEIMVDVRKARNPAHHRLYWAIIRFVQMHSPVMSGFPQERIHIALKIACDLVDRTIDLETGKVVLVPRSIAFESMDQTRFNKFFDDAVEIVTTRWMPPHTTAAAVRAEILDMVTPYKDVA
jgi:hypothetical protein